ncbi:monovalent cation/H(+) antiporter subunit G [Zavarzinia compransoris]|uniref:monovalent cation/H(+) antiporter subunit G n=1 Tax=Zavarzinia marina TaxID=2911065 RepID=UPI001F25BF9D|nr:monovalent cation/H(+) antiporter subunit G [Zavarzinia marina]MCF4164101.1 monovalent cation/H(+) antiporter subunit G [Zavarzinia marina]
MTAADILDLGRNVLGDGLVFLGAFATLVGAIGLLRLPDFYTRAHAGGVTDTAGAIGILVGLAILSPDLLTALKLLIVLVVALFASPTSCHALARAAFRSGIRPALDGDRPPPPQPGE